MVIKKIHLIIICIVIVLVLAGLWVVTRPALDARFVGTWEEARGTIYHMTFYDDRTCTYENVNYEWTTVNDELLLTNSETELRFDFTFSTEDRTLTLTDSEGDTVQWNKQV